MGKSAAEHVARVRERAHAIWEREGRPEGGAERHWAQAEEELRAEAPDAGAAPASTAGTETWTGPGGAVGGEPQAGDQGQAQTSAAEKAEVIGKTRRRAKA
jgi:hypothetical protein